MFFKLFCIANFGQGPYMVYRGIEGIYLQI